MNKEELKDKLEEVVEHVKEKFEEIKESARMNDDVPIEVKREITRFCSGYEKGEKARAIREAEKAYLSIKGKLAKAEIPHAEKLGIERNLKSMYPGNYVRQNIEVDSMIDTVLTVIKNNK